MATKCLIYCRVSSQRQVDEGHGLDGQEKRCRDYAISQGYQIIDVFPDEAMSGGLFDRPGMKKLLNCLEKYQNEPEKVVVVFDDLKRFARDTEVHFGLKREIYGRNGRVECPNFKFEDSPEGKFVETVMAATSELERNQNKRQVKQKMKARIDLGFWPFCPPLGLANTKDPIRGKVLTNQEPLASIFKEAIEGFGSRKLMTLLTQN
jgi:site-specific DNA recombinase